MVKKVVFTYVWVLFMLVACGVGGKKVNSEEWKMQPVAGVCDTVFVDTMDVRNPFVRYIREDDCYYMVGDGGYMWVSKDLCSWVGPYDVIDHDTASWVGASPVITSPEIHEFAKKYYCMATVETAEHHSCAMFVADRITGPYKTIDSESFMLDTAEVAGFPTFCKDEYDYGYMIYNHSGEQSGDGTVQVVMLNENFGRRLGEAFVMFRASQVPWSYKVENGERVKSSVMESPYIVYSGKDGFGVLFTAYAGDEKAVGVAYSETSMLNGPWIIEEEPLLRGYGSASLFDDYDGTPVMVVSKDTVINGVEKSVPRFFKTDLQFEKLQIKGNYKF